MSVRPEHAALVGRYLEALIGRDYDTLAALAEPDVVQILPQSGERVRGATAFVEILRRNPDPPQLLAGPFLTSCRDDLVLAEAKFDYGGRPWWYVDRFELRGERIRRMTSYFGEPFEVPDWRRPFVELEPTIDPQRWADDGDGQPVDRSVPERYFQSLVDRDPQASIRLFHPDVRILYPQSGERFGADGFLAEAAAYPGGLPTSRPIEIGGGREEWVVTPMGVPLRVSGDSDTWFGEAHMRYPSGERLFAVMVVTFRGGLIWRERAYYCPPFEPAAWRADLVERFDPLAPLG
ncbi:MAG: nuclear transport factor 2 family protein [Chloroflexi bacterium]|nr:nuclear transport factor 2 family protein [Chloroflexota bacterium]